ncbi:malto-oligosyltrehalose synthase [Burkholderia glumae]|uniref:malto-oligosyltrehalose synthase n=1 Tax=Burkholderia glumae TaxID=337 RepID=UPI002151AD98|nr:malto-oligosyltrehalose synthase [Burkholderia glumae]UVS99031.1 malto-oligosyltrehalose synthase [Burkholderia glumae]
MSAPRATLRLQLHAGFTFDDAAAQVDLYAQLGISHLYLSPITQAEPGSMHGYDTVDYGRVSEALGGEHGLVRLVGALRRHGIGTLVDFVPNHMGVAGSSNGWWNDVLEWGPRSRYARHFDIDWRPADPLLHGRVLLPCLGRPYGEALAAGEMVLGCDAATGRFTIACSGRTLPVALAAYPEILRAAQQPGLDALAARFAPLADAPPGTPQAGLAGAALREHLAAHGAAALDGALRHYASDSEAGRARLHALLERQAYRLAWWRTAPDEINWRRFFDIDTLAGVRVEDDAVFDDVHALLFRLVDAGLVDGVRIDHVDGLADPRGYCRKLRARLAELRDPAPYLVVEKILAPGEALPADWLTDGTTGYDFMNDVGALLHDPAGAEPLAQHWAELSGSSATFADEALTGKREAASRQLAVELERVTDALHAIARADARTRDFARNPLRRVVAELAAQLPVYRLYPLDGERAAERPFIEAASRAARRALPRTDHEALERVLGWLGWPEIARGDARTDAETAIEADAGPDPALARRARIAFARLSSPLAAKGVEDTACYRYGRLLSRNEVGADAGQLALSPDAFHLRNLERAARTPHTLLATATHDHKRGEDVRARLAVLSEVPVPWRAAVDAWIARNDALCRVPAEGAPPAPGRAAQAMLYQTLVGCWPPALAPDDAEGLAALAERVVQWQTKALREAKRETSWLAPDAAYEAACEAFVRELLRPRGQDDFVHALHAFVARIAPAGVVNSLLQTVLRIASPGVPDLYQGTDLWDFSLVDPDNRREVDFAERRATPVDGPLADYLRTWPDGRIKRALVTRMLALRADHAATFSHGAYLPLTLEGPARKHAIALLRRDTRSAVLVVGSRLAHGRLATDGGGPRIDARYWGDTALVLPDDAPAQWLERLGAERRVAAANGRLRVAELLAGLPVAALVGTP